MASLEGCDSPWWEGRIGGQVVEEDQGRVGKSVRACYRPLRSLSMAAAARTHRSSSGGSVVPQGHLGAGALTAGRGQADDVVSARSMTVSG